MLDFIRKSFVILHLACLIAVKLKSDYFTVKAEYSKEEAKQPNYQIASQRLQAFVNLQ